MELVMYFMIYECNNQVFFISCFYRFSWRGGHNADYNDQLDTMQQTFLGTIKGLEFIFLDSENLQIV